MMRTRGIDIGAVGPQAHSSIFVIQECLYRLDSALLRLCEAGERAASVSYQEIQRTFYKDSPNPNQRIVK